VNYAVKIGSDVLMYKPSFTKIGSAIQKSIGVENTKMHRYIDSKVIS
jgi:hypothetical protein